jgi:hypothetical protein
MCVCVCVCASVMQTRVRCQCEHPCCVCLFSADTASTLLYRGWFGEFRTLSASANPFFTCVYFLSFCFYLCFLMIIMSTTLCVVISVFFGGIAVLLVLMSLPPVAISEDSVWLFIFYPTHGCCRYIHYVFLFCMSSSSTLLHNALYRTALWVGFGLSIFLLIFHVIGVYICHVILSRVWHHIRFVYVHFK